MPDRAAVLEARAGRCPRCGSGLRFEDEDGTRECVCGWSERTRGTPAAGPEGEEDDTLPV